MQLWDRIVRRHRIKRFFTANDISVYAKQHRVSAGVIDQAAGTIAEYPEKKRAEILKSMELILNSYVELVNGGKHGIRKQSIDDIYTPEALNMNLRASELVAQFRRFDKYLRSSEESSRKYFNLLFYGLPGTGKSQLARYLADQIGRKSMIKALSDILDPYVGITERNIREIFKQAENEEAVLVVDEVDSLLFPRQNAMHSWESSMTNEFLTAMENHKGILICTTNIMHGIDMAAIRRFNHKIKFDFMTSKGNFSLYQKMLQPLSKEYLSKSNTSRIFRFKKLTPGDYRVVREKFIFFEPEEISHKMLIDALEEEANMKNNYIESKKIGF